MSQPRQPAASPRSAGWFNGGGDTKKASEAHDAWAWQSSLYGNTPAQKPERSTLQRLYRSFLGGRALLALALLLTLQGAGVWGNKLAPSVSGILIVYAIAAMAMWVIPWLGQMGTRISERRLRWRQIGLTIGVDLLVFAGLHFWGESGGFNYAALLVLPVVMAGALAPRMVSLSVAASASLILLLEAIVAYVGGSRSVGAVAQAGITGIGFFFVAVLMAELSEKLLREEEKSRDNLEIARQQATLNRLVMQEMQEGVVVVDRQGKVRAANPAAQQLLRLHSVEERVTRLKDRDDWLPLVHAIDEAFDDSSAEWKKGWPQEGKLIQLAATASVGPAVDSSVTSLNGESAQKRQLHLRMRFTHRQEGDLQEDFCVLFLEDMKTLQARLRQEKLAAMGRVSAGIAHEIRNPLAAIAQANALMSEDAQTPYLQQLTRMVSDNVDRLKRIVDDVMEITPGMPVDSPLIDVLEMVSSTVREWAQTHDIALLNPVSPVQLELPEGTTSSYQAHFDPHHLRRILVNLLDNSHRHGTGSAAATVVKIITTEALIRVMVLSDSPRIDPEIEERLFEPFFSTRSRGSGLGLYICRELATQHQADVEYHPGQVGSRHPNEFHLLIPRIHVMPAQTHLPLGA